jgi:AcrR family transcriptional regulator
MDASTREAILLAAERLFAERGFGVSLREIGAAAGQRNHSAVQYHFGGKERLINALFEHRMVPLNQRRLDIIAALRATGREHDPGALVDAFIRPLAEHILGNRGESWYLRFAVRLALSGFRPGLRFDDSYYEGMNILTGLLTAALPDLPAERLLTMNLHVIAVLASLELRCEDAVFADDQAAEVTRELVSTTVAILTAPERSRAA